MVDQIQSLLEKTLQPEKGYGKVAEAMRYAALGRGKRLRPRIVLEVAKALGGKEEEALIPAVAIELIHAYSLVHDDLPCMDDDDIRRGKPSLHRAFNEAVALLAGDGLLTKAFELIAGAKKLEPLVRCRLLSLIAQESGIRGMVGGQGIDLEKASNKIGLKERQEMHKQKTGALFAASFGAGALIAHAKKETFEKLREAGRLYGLAFQIADDLEDKEIPKECSYREIEEMGREYIKNFRETLQKLSGDFGKVHHFLQYVTISSL